MCEVKSVMRCFKINPFTKAQRSIAGAFFCLERHLGRVVVEREDMLNRYAKRAICAGDIAASISQDIQDTEERDGRYTSYSSTSCRLSLTSSSIIVRLERTQENLDFFLVMLAYSDSNS